jgi:hypothetical protein
MWYFNVAAQIRIADWQTMKNWFPPTVRRPRTNLANIIRFGRKAELWVNARTGPPDQKSRPGERESSQTSVSLHTAARMSVENRKTLRRFTFC